MSRVSSRWKLLEGLGVSKGLCLSNWAIIIPKEDSNKIIRYLTYPVFS